MADFTLGIGEAQPSPITERSFEADTSTAELIGGLTRILPTSAQAAAWRASKANKEMNTVVGAFLQDQLRVAEAVSQGSISSKAGRGRARVNLAAALANNEALSSELLAAHKGLMGAAGGAKVIAEGTEEEKQYIKDSNEAQGNGWIRRGATEEERVIDTEVYVQSKLISNRLDAIVKGQTVAKGQQSFKAGETSQAKAELELNRVVFKQEAEQALVSYSNAYSHKFGNSVNAIMQEVDSGTIDEIEGIKQLDAEWSVINTTVRSLGIGAGADFANAVVDPMRSLYTASKEMLSGTTTNLIYSNRVAQLKAKQKLMILNDPRALMAASLQDLFKEASIVTFPVINSLVTDLVGQAEEGLSGNPFPTDVRHKKSLEGYLRLLKDNIVSQNGGKTPDNTTLQTQFDSVIKSIPVYGVQANPEDMDQMVTWLADPEVGKWLKGGRLDKSTAPQALAMLQQQYAQKVAPLIRKEFTEGVTGGVGGADVKAVIKPVFQGAGVVFVPIDVADNYSPIRYSIRARIEQLNREVSPVINKIIRATAHLSGEDYKSTYEAYSEQLLGVTPTQAEPKKAEAPLKAPKVGEVVRGYRFKGGDKKDKSNWEQIDGQ